MITDGLESCGLLVNYCDGFISCLDSYFDGTHSLQRIHWWASDATFLQICFNKKTNSSTSCMTWGWVNFHCWVNYPLIIYDANTNSITLNSTKAQNKTSLILTPWHLPPCTGANTEKQTKCVMTLPFAEVQRRIRDPSHGRITESHLVWTDQQPATVCLSAKCCF